MRQAGYVVADLASAVRGWESVGVGPWTCMETRPRGMYRGAPSAPALAVGFARSGRTQIELIAVLDDEPSVWQESRHAGRFGLHHVAYWTDDFDGTLARADLAGLDVVQAGGQEGAEPRFVYLEAPAVPMMVEIMELTDASRAFMEGAP